MPGSTAANLSTANTANTAKEIGSQSLGCFKQTNVNPTIEETGNKEGRESRRKEQAMTHVSEQMAISCPGSMLRSFLLDLGGLKGLCWLCHAPLHRYCPSSQCLNNLDVRLKVLYCIIKYHKSVYNICNSVCAKGVIFSCAQFQVQRSSGQGG